MRLNEAVIPHYRSEMIPVNELKKHVAWNERYLTEKPTWYQIDNRLQYFKIRNDFRLFTEQFFSIFGKQVMDLDTLSYQIAYVRTISDKGRSNDEQTKCGLLSECFQDNSHNYYLVSEMMDAKMSNLITYGGYSLKNLLSFFKDYLASDEYTENELFLIKLFISDAFTHQEDRNFHNISFKISKIEGVSCFERLRPNKLAENSSYQQHLELSNNSVWRLKNFSPVKVYDNERILSVDHKNQLKYTEGQVWKPLFPYSLDTLYKSSEEAKNDSIKNYEGLDPNLLLLFIDYQNICQPIFERLVYDDEYKKILEIFQGNSAQIILSDKDVEYFSKIFENKRETFGKILRAFR